VTYQGCAHFDDLAAALRINTPLHIEMLCLWWMVNVSWWQLSDNYVVK